MRIEEAHRLMTPAINNLGSFYFGRTGIYRRVGQVYLETESSPIMIQPSACVFLFAKTYGSDTAPLREMLTGGSNVEWKQKRGQHKH